MYAAILHRGGETLVHCDDTWATIKRGWRGSRGHKEWALELLVHDGEGKPSELALEHVTALRLVLEKAEAEMVKLTDGDDPEILEEERRRLDAQESLAWKACIRFLVINDLWDTDYRAEAKGQEADLLWKDGSRLWVTGGLDTVCLSLMWPDQEEDLDFDHVPASHDFAVPEFAERIRLIPK